MQQFRVRVPASTANLGPGFDSLGLALQLYLTVTVDLADQAVERAICDCQGKGMAMIVLEENVIMQIWEGHLNQSLRSKIHTVHIDSDIPVGKGLGSSGAAIVAAYALVQLLETKTLDRQLLFKNAFAEEGHPDNVAPSVYGHLCIATVPREGLVRRIRLASDLRIFLLVPELATSTNESRETLPTRRPLRASIANIRSTAHLVSCLVSSDFEHIKEGLFDALHEQKRLSLVPIMGEPWVFLRDSSETYGVFLSGSGPTLAAFCKEGISVGSECVQILQRHGIAAQTYCLPIDYEGITWTCS